MRGSVLEADVTGPVRRRVALPVNVHAEGEAADGLAARAVGREVPDAASE